MDAKSLAGAIIPIALRNPLPAHVDSNPTLIHVHLRLVSIPFILFNLCFGLPTQCNSFYCYFDLHVASNLVSKHSKGIYSPCIET